jgi:hypothetical protein
MWSLIIFLDDLEKVYQQEHAMYLKIKSEDNKYIISNRQ